MGGGLSEQLKAEVDNKIKSNKVMVFSKTTCGYCAMAKQALDELNVSYEVMELNQRSDGAQIQSYLYDMTGENTVPRVFINGKCIGGGSETMALKRQGKLLDLINAC